MNNSASLRTQASRLHWVALALLATLLIPPAFSQAAAGRIVGIVTDPAGARVVGAKVTVTSVETNVASQTTTTNEGSYQVLDLPIGNYRVTVQQEGFSTVETQPTELQINQTLRVDVHLAIGALAQTVSVESVALQVETQNPTIGGTVTGATVQNLPLNGRDTMSLMNTQPGVAGSGANRSTTVSIAGGRGDNVSYLLDGGNNNSVRSSALNFDPNPDTIAEFRLLMNNYTAEYGRSGGGIVSVVTKSGTNQLHGSLYDYLRNTDLDANDFFLNSTGQPRANLKRNQFGGTLGGPVVIPKLVHGKDRFFFFFGYQGTRQVQQSLSSLSQTFTPAELTGDFSKAANGKPDPNVVSFLQAYPYYQSNPALAAQGIIDPTKVDPVFKNFVKANLITTSPTGSIVAANPSQNNVDEYTIKTDFLATSNDRIAVTLGYNRNPQLPTGINPGFPLATYASVDYANIAYTKTLTPHVLNEFRVSVNRDWTQGDNPSTTTPGPQALGINVNPDKTLGSPQIVMPTGYLSLGYNPNNSALADNTYGYADSVTWIKGRHTFKGGFSFVFAQENSIYNYDTMGEFDFSGSGTSIGSGNPLADFALGLPDSFSQYPSAISNSRQKQMAGFFQDEWKLTPRLLLTLGLRYEYSTPQIDTLGRSFSILPGEQSQRFVGAPVGAVFPGDPGVPKGLYFPDKNNFAPRIGIAWDPFGDGKTSVRAGAGVFYNILNGWTMDENNGVAPYYAGVSFSNNGGNSLGPITSQPQYMSNPYAANGLPNPFPSHATLSSKDPNLFTELADLPFGSGDWFADPHLRTPYIYQFNLSVQRQLARNLALDVSYVGSISHKLTNMMDGNPIVLGTNVRLLNVGQYPYFTDPVRGLTDNGFVALPQTITNNGEAHYNGLLSSITKRMGDWHGFGATFFTAAFTWSHNIDNGTGSITSNAGDVPYYNHDALMANSTLDRRHLFVLSGGWELPFGNLWSSGPKSLTRGWTLYPIFTDNAGQPFDILSGLKENSLGNKVGPSGAGDLQLVRAALTVPTIQILNPGQMQTINGTTGLFYFSPADVTVPKNWNSASFLPAPGTYTYGMPRDSIPGIGLVNLDLALAKKTPLFHERINSEFRIEAFNALNHTEFANPTTTVSSPFLGQVTSTLANSYRIVQVALRVNF